MKTYKITKPNQGTILEVKDDGVVVEKYVFNTGADLQQGYSAIIIDSHSKSVGTIKIPFDALEDNAQANISALMDFFDVNGYFTETGGGTGGGTPGTEEGTYIGVFDIATNGIQNPDNSFTYTFLTTTTLLTNISNVMTGDTDVGPFAQGVLFSIASNGDVIVDSMVDLDGKYIRITGTL